MTKSLSDQDIGILENPVWEALASHQASFAERQGGAALYAMDVSPFGALERHDEACMEDLTRLCAPGRIVALWARPEPLPAHPQWELLETADVRQMVRLEDSAEADGAGERLGDGHIEEMVELVKLTNPGPFLKRTIALGSYLGIFEGDRLVAMAGERFKPAGWTEISAVCTHPDAAGRGYAAALVSRLVREVDDRGEGAFLHVRIGSPSEHGAARIYQRLGFVDHQKMRVSVLRRLP